MERILLIDDDENIQKLCSTYLEICGYEVISAYNKKQGLKELDGNPEIDLILLDNYMPTREDGWAFNQTLQDNVEYKKYKDIPIIAIGEFSSEQKESFIYSINKPFNTSELEEIIQKALS